MGRYLAIVRDSYREAFSSRVLTIMLVLSTLFILVAASIGWWETQSLDVTLGEKNGKAWLGLSIKKSDPDGAAISSTSMNGPALELGETWGCYLTKLNSTAINSRDDVAEFMKTAKIGDTVKLTVARPTNDLFGYNPLKEQGSFFWALPTRIKIISFVGFVQKWILGLFGVIIALVVTAGFMPKFLETGSMHLVMSRPVSRFGVIIARYIGGLSFVIILALYLIGGVILVVQLRSGISILSTLWAIPILIFLFAQFYAVSCFVSIVTKNQILTVIASVIFYGLALSFNLVNVNIDVFANLMNPTAIQLLANGERVNVESLSINNNGGRRNRLPYTISQYRVGIDADDRSERRRKLHQSVGSLPSIQNNRKIVAISNSSELMLLDSRDNNLRDGLNVTVRGIPRKLVTHPNGRYVAIYSSTDLACFDIEDRKRLNWAKPQFLFSSGRNRSGVDLEQEPEFAVSAMAFHQNHLAIALLDGRIRISTIEDGKNVAIFESGTKSPIIGLASLDGVLFAVDEAGKVLNFKGEFSATSKADSSSNLSVRKVTTIKQHIGSGLVAVATDFGQLVIAKSNSGKLTINHTLGGMASIKDVSFSEDGQFVAAADKNGSVTIWSTKSGTQTGTVDLLGTLGKFQTVFNIGSYLFPRTKKLDELSTKLMSGYQVEEENEDNQLKDVVEINYFTVIASGMIFIIIVLSAGSLIFQMRDL